MTDTIEAVPNVRNALDMIDGQLGRFATRDVVSATEVSDLLLDLRLLLVAADVDAADPEPAPIG